MDRAQDSPEILKSDPLSLNWGRTVAGFFLAGAVSGCLVELLHVAWPGTTGGTGGWAFLYRAILGGMGCALTPAIGYRLTHRGPAVFYGCALGAVMAGQGPVPSAFGWAELFKVGLRGIFLGLFCGLGAAVFAYLVPWNPTKPKVAPDPLDDGL